MFWYITVFLLLVGLVLIVKGGDLFVDAASWMAEKTGIPKFIIGATIVSVATTLPEITVSCIAALEGKTDMAIGNAIGSVSANIGLIMGIALICIPFKIQRKAYAAKILLMLGAASVLTVFGLTGSLPAIAQAILFIIFALSMLDNLIQAKKAQKIKTATSSLSDKKISAKAPKNETPLMLFKFVAGTAFILLGSQLLVDNGSLLALYFGIPERVIAVSVVAIGTSLPELVTTITAIKKKQGALSIGNIIGANIIDLTLILPLSSFIGGQALPVSRQFALVDIPACLILSAIALIPTFICRKFSRWQGVLLVLFYILYLVYTTFN